ncbi:hypothetical protein EDD37DRAFT_693317 [Exophiala viscosa]|uniref:Uncharacterized protein n=1 Tax=Exophiala viscosa TaxID=2486360 RepID=A0AAN6DXM1_9EURO|nr:hypothetical protein EDD36DRAFT_419461 [Exophiala viscosa]KAI1626396.1 hypothetical protein EDD37DRAFT_693317 [Exophiala viscosa]
MAQARNRRQSSDALSAFTIDDCTSVNSGDPVNQPFFSKSKKQPLPPSHTASTTWKSNYVKEQEEFERVKHRVKHIAPEHFKADAKPGRGPSEIFPQDVTEWTQHKKEILAIAQAEQQKNCELLKAQITARTKIPKQQRKIKSVFGVDGKVFNDSRGPVLAVPTIWSDEHSQVQATWPTLAELRWNGDSRECKLARTKCGRYLPPPRDPSEPSLTWHDQPFLRASPLDQTGPVYTQGPRPDEVYEANDDMNNDAEFEKPGNFFLGDNLMQEIGEWRPSFVPEWRQEQPGMRGELFIQDGQLERELVPGISHDNYAETHVEVMETLDFGIIGGHLKR